MEGPLSILLRDNKHHNATVRLALKVDQLSIQVQRNPIVQAAPGMSPIILDLGSVKPSITISGTIDNKGTDPAQLDEGFWHMEKMTLSGPNGSGGSVSHPYYVPYKNYLEAKLSTWITGSENPQLEVGDASLVEGDSGILTAGVDAVDTLESNVDATANGIPIDGANSNFYVGQHILIDDEIMKVTALPGSSTLTCARDQKGTDGASHSAGATIYSIGVSKATKQNTGGGIYNVAVSNLQFNLIPGQEDRWAFTVQFVGHLRTGIKF
tara:strand:- start:662 stop:1462 length:801 start_codon:yes stop_codon:yes gene_type:complete